MPVEKSSDTIPKMLAGEPYLPLVDPVMLKLKSRARNLQYRLNNYPPSMYKDGITPEETFGGVDGRKYEVIAELFDVPLEKAKKLAIEPPFYCDHGVFIEFKGTFYCNYNTVILDCAKVTIGDRVALGPNVSIYAATHSTDVGERLEELERAYPVEIGDDVWIGGSVTIVCSAKGTRIGNGCAVAAGTTLWGTFPDNVVIAGNPPRIIKHLESPIAVEQK